MTVRHDALSWFGSAVALAGIVWLGPLMLDQLVFFGDRDQTADAATARGLMIWPVAMLVAGAGVLAVRRHALHAVVAAAPLVAVALAWAEPEAAYQLLAYGVTAPAAVGSLLAASMPLRGAASRPAALVAVGLAGAVAIAVTPVLGGVAALALIAWWALSRWPRPARAASALD